MLERVVAGIIVGLVFRVFRNKQRSRVTYRCAECSNPVELQRAQVYDPDGEEDERYQDEHEG